MVKSPERVSVSNELDSATATTAGMPLAISSKQTLGQGFVHLIEERLAAVLRGVRVERVTVRFEDLNGPKGGVDTACRIQLRLSAHPTLVVEARAEAEGPAFRLALPRLVSALDRQLSRRTAKPRVSLRTQFARAS
jgi:putative sigma-54 modulation protein